MGRLAQEEKGRLLQLLADGWEYDQIAAKLKVSYYTVKSRIEQLMRETAAINRSNLIAQAFRQKMVV